VVNGEADETGFGDRGVGLSRAVKSALRTRYSALLRRLRGHAGSLGKHWRWSHCSEECLAW